MFVLFIVLFFGVSRYAFLLFYGSSVADKAEIGVRESVTDVIGRYQIRFSNRL